MQWIRETTTTTGTGNLTLAEVSGSPRVSTLVPLNVPVPYVILDDTTLATIEAGIGFLSGTNTFVRARQYTTNNSGTIAQQSLSPVSLPAGTKRLIVAHLSQTVAPLLPVIGNITGDKAISNGLVSGAVSAANYNDLDTANRFNVHPWLHLYGGPVDAFIIDVSTAVASSTVRAGLYSVNLSTGGPGTLLVEVASAFNTATTGTKTGTFSAVVLPPGFYYLGLWTSHAGVALTGHGTANNASFVTAPWGQGNSSIASAGYALGVSAGSGLPTTFPALGGTTPNMKFPYVRVRAV